MKKVLALILVGMLVTNTYALNWKKFATSTGVIVVVFIGAYLGGFLAMNATRGDM
ncbi:MAG: hypothetical protein Nk1A_4600 [Endomicrobiia bacterium]|nr:MAG: hypothetical protein Nk1A_4600 [Endomicrobiia bacterium]